MIVKWRWWYGPDCIQAPGLEKFDTQDEDYLCDADQLAADIVQEHIDANGTDGSNEFEIEIVEPAEFAGVYDVGLDWHPTAFASRRAA